MDKLLKDIVKERMSERGMNPKDLQSETGIPAERIYKWYSKQRPANPKEADGTILRKWLESSKSIKEEVPNTGNEVKEKVAAILDTNDPDHTRKN